MFLRGSDGAGFSGGVLFIQDAAGLNGGGLFVTVATGVWVSGPVAFVQNTAARGGGLYANVVPEMAISGPVEVSACGREGWGLRIALGCVAWFRGGWNLSRACIPTAEIDR